MPDEPDRDFTLAMRVEKMVAAVPGSEEATCGACGEDVWLSPATLEEIEDGAYPDVIRCATCVVGADDE